MSNRIEPLSKNTRQIPDFFSEVRERAQKRWDQLESDPELAGPWKQLFAQVQSPRHVLSELLQNADDAGAKHAWAKIDGDYFIFEHDGEDFNEEQFTSLCRFGFSNKRKLHTIGFRGIGFKSTFSLGKIVEVLTPSLAIYFEKNRFTEPIWINDASICERTRIMVRIQDSSREGELRKNLLEWINSPASLLFFSSIGELSIENNTIRKEIGGPGPLPNSERLILTGCEQNELIVFLSPEVPFPNESIGEIRQERNAEELNLPPCRVEIITGLPGRQRLYVVLPTQVTVRLPFSCNAPFIQDPARMAIKEPSLSPTNKWLLQRIGKLAGKVMSSWLADTSLSMRTRAKAYCLLPEPFITRNDLETDVSREICLSQFKATGSTSILLTTDGRLVESNACIAPPRDIYSVWSPSVISEIFGKSKAVLSEELSDIARNILGLWGWLEELNPNGIIMRLSGGSPPPKPEKWEQLLILWSYIKNSFEYRYQYKIRRQLKIVPVNENPFMLSADELVRLPLTKSSISDEAWNYLISLASTVDHQWLEYIGKADPQDDRKPELEIAKEVLKEIGLDASTPIDKVITNACRRFFTISNIGINEYIKITHIIAALDAKSPDEFMCIDRNEKIRSLRDGIIVDQNNSLADLFPSDWINTHLLHGAYYENFTYCRKQDWDKWVISEKSGFIAFAPIAEKTTPISYWSKHILNEIFESRQVEPPKNYPYKQGHYEIRDNDFYETLWEHWRQLARTDPTIWLRVMDKILQAPTRYWNKRIFAELFQWGSIYSKRVECSPIPANWVMSFSILPCLPNTYGTPHVPAELLMRSPETEPLIGLEPFVKAELDNRETKPLLKLLGVRDTPASLDKLLGRIRALSRAEDPTNLIYEIAKWYEALDRVLARCNSNVLNEAIEIFKREKLIFTGASEWVSTSEVFRNAHEEDIPDVPIVHPSINNLSLWTRIGVADRPSSELILRWLNCFPSGKAIDPQTVRRVRSSLQRYPFEVWENCKHWLALDSTWIRIDQFKFRLTMRGLMKWGDLFPAIKIRTADMRMLPKELSEKDPFPNLSELDSAIEYRLIKNPHVLQSPVSKPWLAALAYGLQKIKFSDDSQTHNVRNAAARLGRSVWQPCQEIRVIPYIDGSPAGPQYTPNIIWHDDKILIREDNLAKYFEVIAKELSAPFDDPDVADAIKACIGRDDDFITNFLKEHFILESEAPETSFTEPISSEPIDALKPHGVQTQQEIFQELKIQVPPEVNESPANNNEPEILPRDESYTPPPRRDPPSLQLIDRFAFAKGFRWDDFKQRYVNHDGYWMEKNKGPFNWVLFNNHGDVVMNFWVSSQYLIRGGTEIPAEIWEMVNNFPQTSCLVLLDEYDQPWELFGEEIIRMKTSGEITLFPAKYRIRMETR